MFLSTCKVLSLGLWFLVVTFVQAALSAETDGAPAKRATTGFFRGKENVQAKEVTAEMGEFLEVRDSKKMTQEQRLLALEAKVPLVVVWLRDFSSWN